MDVLRGRSELVPAADDGPAVGIKQELRLSSGLGIGHKTGGFVVDFLEVPGFLVTATEVDGDRGLHEDLEEAFDDGAILTGGRDARAQKAFHHQFPREREFRLLDNRSSCANQGELSIFQLDGRLKVGEHGDKLRLVELGQVGGSSDSH